MRKLLFVGCLCLGASMLAAGEGGCSSKCNKKGSPENADTAKVRLCKAFAEIIVRHSACGEGEPDWEGASKEEQATVIAEFSSRCEAEPDAMMSEIECESLNMSESVVSAFEKAARAQREASDCNAVLAVELPTDGCLD